MAWQLRAPAFRNRVLNLAKTCSISGLRSGEYFRQAGRRGGLRHPGSPSAQPFPVQEPRIVEDHDVAWLQRRHEELFDIGVEALAVDRPVEQAGRVDAVVSQGGEESRGLPLALRDLVEPSRWPLGAPAAQAGHIGLGPGFIDEDQLPGVDEPLIGSPSFAVATYGPGDPARLRQGSFDRDAPIRRKKRLIIEGVGFDPSRSAERRSHSA